jgi:hypothetical protein
MTMATSAAKDDIMIIEVEIEDWQFDCCGEPFSVGAEVSWDIHAAIPGTGRADVPRFYEDHHDLVDDGVPEVEITGTVQEIYATADRVVSVPGMRVRTNDPEDNLEERVKRAKRFHKSPEGYTHRGFRVRLEVPDDADLPLFVETRWIAQRDAEQRKLAARIAKLRAGAVGQQLVALAQSVAAEFGHRVRVDASEKTTGVTIQPANPKATTIRWGHVDKTLHVEVGEGAWDFKPARAGLEPLSAFIEAAAAGRVVERVTDHDVATIITDADGTRYSVTVEYKLPRGSGYFIAEREFERYQSGDVDYEPW